MLLEPAIFAYVFSVFTAVFVFFQLALGAPWGEMAMGGKFSGHYPPQMRVATLVQMVGCISSRM